ncbi:MAG: Rne/Rng family ribonuclease [Candidatus Coatesbacteria bacterium]|nr:Rne/Rng family ribonuclease [Candidatus Coatesbacteria bacterium]
MNRKIIINDEAGETRIGILENDMLVELYVARRENMTMVGNVFKGRVSRVLPGMQAAFVDIGLERDAFLYVTDVYDTMDEFERLMMSSEADGDLQEEQLLRTKPKSSLSIEQLLVPGQTIVVQITKDPIGAKGARASSFIALAGRFLVLQPSMPHVSISRRIEHEAERNRLKEVVGSLKPEGMGVIIRTLAVGHGEDEFRADIEFLNKLWHQIYKRSESAPAPSLIYSEPDPILRTVRDFFTPDVERVVIDSEEAYQRCAEYVDEMLPGMAHRVKLFVKDTPIFDEYGIESEIQRALRPKVWLRSGGFLVIDQTEALVSIDVNTGKYVGKESLEETLLNINLEATKELARQLRLRDLGGIIVIDFIDMESEKNKEHVLNALSNELRKDRSKTSITEISTLGLVEMTRKRVRESLERMLCEKCPYCGGIGRIRSRATVCYEIQREIRRVAEFSIQKEILVRAHPSVANMLQTKSKDIIMEFERTFNKRVLISADAALHPERFDVVSV